MYYYPVTNPVSLLYEPLPGSYLSLIIRMFLFMYLIIATSLVLNLKIIKQLELFLKRMRRYTFIAYTEYFLSLRSMLILNIKQEMFLSIGHSTENSHKDMKFYVLQCLQCLAICCLRTFLFTFIADFR